MSLVRPITKSARISKNLIALALDHAERHPLPADFLHQAPEDVTAIEREEREEVDDRQREADHREQGERLSRTELDRLVGNVADPNHAGELLALFGLEDPHEG